MSERPSYRSMYATFWDDPEVIDLSDRAYRVLTTLKGTLPAAGVGNVYDDLLAHRCKCTEAELHEAYRELERPKQHSDLGWIVRERNLVWIVNGLRFEPTLRSSDSKHRRHVADTIAQFGGALSPLRIVALFRLHYPEWFPGEVPPPSGRKSSPGARPSDTAAPEQSPPQDDSSNGSGPARRRRPTKTDPDPHEGSGQGSNEGASEGSREAQDKTITKTIQTNPLPARARAEAGGDVISIDDGRRRMAYLTRAVIALNIGMRANAATAPTFLEIATTTQSGAVTWFEDGIAIETAEAVIAQVCSSFRPTPGGRQINGLRYFDAKVRERWSQLEASGDVARYERELAKQRANPEYKPSSPERLAILRKQGYAV
jgi:hypothetical protein